MSRENHSRSPCRRHFRSHPFRVRGACSEVGAGCELWCETLATVADMPCEGTRVAGSTRKHRGAAGILPLSPVPALRFFFFYRVLSCFMLFLFSSTSNDPVATFCHQPVTCLNKFKNKNYFGFRARHEHNPDKSPRGAVGKVKDRPFRR